MRRILLLAAAALAACADRADDATPDAAADTATADSASFAITDIGLQSPTAVLYDDRLDVYFVSNTSGGATARDGAGFIARIRPNGDVETLRWIDGEAEGVRLNAPKGLAFLGDTLLVADIDTVRMFHRVTGRPLGAIGVPDAVYLSDVAVSSDGVYVTDTGVGPDMAPLARDAIYRLDALGGTTASGTGVTAIARGRPLMQPYAIVVEGGNVLMVPYATNVLFSIPVVGGAPVRVVGLPAGQLTGLVRLPSGALLIVSRAGRAVYSVSPAGEVTTQIDGLDSPADPGWDSRRQRLLIPLTAANRIEIREIR